MVKKAALISFICLLTCILNSCVSNMRQDVGTSSLYADYFDIIELETSKAVVVISPYDLSRDTLLIKEPLDNIICMSSSQVAGMAEIGVDSVITAVSGLRYITNTDLRERQVADIGYEAALDYEKILSLRPDLLLTYTVSGAEPAYISRLRSLGVPVLVLHDHLENHPLARAEYIRLYGALTGHEGRADSLFTTICERYDSLAVSNDFGKDRKKVLMNVPYGDAWYIPGGDSYMAKLVKDAGGQVIGSEPGTASRVIRMEEAYSLSREADIWLNPGPCRTRDELVSYHHAFRHFGPVVKDLPIYNNTLRMTPEGGNDFWESGSVRPDLVLEDLVAVFAQSVESSSLKYHFEVK